MTNSLPSSGHQISTLIDEFLDEATRQPPAGGNLVIGIDATASRQPTWDNASHLLGAMFKEVAAIGTLDVKTIFFRGTEHIDAECKASEWMRDPVQLARYMTGVTCRAGHTQIVRVLDHTLRESNQRKIGALVYIGDCCEEPRTHLVPLARRLADQNIPIFAFQEGRDPEAGMIFRELAQITGGAYCPFDQNSSKQLGELLRAVALFATGGVAALEKQGSDAARLLLGQIR
jgi:hypothetical protein